MDFLSFVLGAGLGSALGLCWKIRAYRALKDRHSRLTDRDERGRFVKRER